MSARFNLRLLGHPQLSRSDAEIGLSPLQWALVALIFAHEDGGVARADLLRLLWPSGTEATLLKRLSQLLYSLDQKVGESIILKSVTSVRPDVRRVETDLATFVRELDEDNFGTASAMLERGFLRGLPLMPTREYEDWMDRRSAFLRAELRNAATRRWARAEQEGLWTHRTLDAANALHRISANDEGALRRAMWAQALISTPMEAIATYESFMDRNRVETAADMEDETVTLLERVRALGKQPRGGSSEPQRVTRADPTLYGRDAELALLRPILSGEVREGLRVIHVAGAAGLGKSRLIRECLGPAALQGRLVLKAQLAELERDIPLNAIIEAFSTQETAKALEPLDEPWRSLLLSLMPEFIDIVGPPKPIPAVQPASLQRRLLEAVRLLVERVVGAGPVVIFLDDFQWVDDSSLAALEYLRRRWAGGSGVLVVNVRPELVEQDGRLRSFLEGDDIVRLDLGELDDVSQKQLVKEVAGGEIPAQTLSSLQSLGGGNPLHLIELTRQWQDGQFEPPERATDEVQLPVSIQQLYEHRFRGLGEAAIRMLEALAVWGKPISVGDAAGVAAVDLAKATEGLEELDRSGLLRWREDGLELWHGLMRQAALSRMSEVRRRWLHGRVVDLVVEGAQDGASDELALHAHRARRKEEAVRYALSAANQADGVGATPEAVHFLRIALSNAGPRDRSEVEFRLAEQLHRSCRYEEGAELFSRVADATIPAGRRLRAQALRLDCLVRLGQGPFLSTLEELQSVRVEAIQASEWETVATALSAAFQHVLQWNRTDLDPELLGDAQLCIDSGDARSACLANRFGVRKRLDRSTVAAGRKSCEASLALATANGLEDLLPRAYSTALLSVILDGRLNTTEGEALESNALRSAESSGDVFAHLQIVCNLASFYLDVREIDRAEYFLGPYSERFSSTDWRESPLLMNRGELALVQGRVSDARRLFSQALPREGNAPGHGWGYVHAGLGLCALEEGKLHEARRAAEKMDDGLPVVPRLPADLSLVGVFRGRLLSRLGQRREAIRHLAELEEEVRGVHVPYLLKLRAERLIMSRRARISFDVAEARAALQTATELRLPRMAAVFQKLA